MKLGYVIQYVDDVPRSLEFYESAFGLERRFLDETKKYGELETGATRLAFAANELVREMLPIDVAPSGPNQSAPPMEIAMVTDDVDAAFAQAVAAGAVEVKSPAMKPWGQRVAYVRDPNGFLVEICSPMP